MKPACIVIFFIKFYLLISTRYLLYFCPLSSHGKVMIFSSIPPFFSIAFQEPVLSSLAAINNLCIFKSRALDINNFKPSIA